MISVYEVFNQYCIDNELPPPSSHDLQAAGAIVGYHFRAFWGIMQRPEVIEQAGFMWSKEPGKTLLVIGYPDVFRPEMVERIKIFLQDKAARISADNARQKSTEKPIPSSSKKPTSDHKKERKRTPTQSPAFSGKPLLKKK